MNRRPHGFTHYIFGATTEFSSAANFENWLKFWKQNCQYVEVFNEWICLGEGDTTNFRI